MAYVFTKKGREEVEVDLNDLKQWKNGIVKCHDEKKRYETVKTTHEYLSRFCEATVRQLEQMSGLDYAGSSGSRKSKKNPEQITHDDGYRNITLNGKRYHLTARQGQIIEYLHLSFMRGAQFVPQAKILEDIDSTSRRLRDAFKSRLNEYRTLIIKDKERDMFGLNIKAFSEK